MEEKIKLLRDKLIKELSSLEEGTHVKLNYDPRICELILFENADKFSTQKLVIDVHGNHVSMKKFALPDDVLSKIDFSNVSFDAFDAREYNFSKLYGVKLDPQKIYDKNLYKTNLKGVEFIGPFDNVYIIAANFAGSTGAKINPYTLYAGYSISLNSRLVNIYGCKFSNVKFIGNFCLGNKGVISLEYTDFTGSIGAKIYVDQLYSKTLVGCKLTDAIVILPKKHTYNISGTDFTGAKSQDVLGMPTNIKINPQQTTGDFKNTIFNGVEFIGPFDDTIITDANFTGSHNAIINLPKIRQNTGYEGTNFTDAFVYGYNHDRLIPTEDGRIISSINYELGRLLNTECENAILGQKELEEAHLKLIKENREKLQAKITELLNLVNSSEKLGVDPVNLYCKVPIEQNLFLVKVDEHYEINRNIIDLSLLRFLNLSHIDFTNVKVSGIDFRYSGARIDPQKVYNKDISYGTFDSGNIKFFDDFTGVNIEGTNFTNCDFEPKLLKKT